MARPSQEKAPAFGHASSVAYCAKPPSRRRTPTARTVRPSTSHRWIRWASRWGRVSAQGYDTGRAACRPAVLMASGCSRGRTSQAWPVRVNTTSAV